MSDEQWQRLEEGIARSYGHCMTMGTASTMTSIAEALGMTLPGAASIPAADANHIRLASLTGERAVGMVWEDIKPSGVLSEKSFHNATVVSMAMGCSTNAVIHLIALARRAGIALSLDDLDAASRTTPVIANIRPIGDQYLMEDFYYAGGLRGLMSVMKDRLALDAQTVCGQTLGKTLEGARVYNDDVIRPPGKAIYQEGSLAVLRGNLAPEGCVIKPASAEKRLLTHTGPAIVFDSYPEMKAVIDADDFEVTADHVLVLRNAGPQGGPGMPEWGMLPIPKKLLKKGVRDMLRLSDARMSGTSYGACVLHISPESHIGGPLALIKTGDLICVDVPNRRIDVKVSEEELAKRRAAWVAPKPRYERGYGWMFLQHVGQAHDGCDFDCLESGFGANPGEPDIF